MPPKRALFSLNVDSEADHIYQRVNDHSKPGKEKTKVIETSGPTVGHTDLQFVTKPFEKLVNRTVEGVEESTGKKVHSAEGEFTYSSQRSSHGTGSNTKTVKDSTRIKRRIEQQYDTSDL
jgi:ribose 5-phosphate isomerase B